MDEVPVRPRVLVLCASYLPGYKRGGPTQSVAAAVNQLSADYSFSVVTEDRDRGDPGPYPAIKSNAWNEVGPAQVFYVPLGLMDFIRVARVVLGKPHDVIYHNSFFDFRFSIFPLILRRFSRSMQPGLIIAPRGEFSPGALLIKPFKKRLFLTVARHMKLYGQALWHASTPEEEGDIRRAMGSDAKVLVARNFPSVKLDNTKLDEDATGVRHRDNGAPLRICFLSRVSRKKNLDYLIGVLSNISSAVQLSIYGPIEDDKYWVECQRLIKSLPKNVSAVYCGAIEHDRVAATIAKHDVFAMPTLGENFGHVFLEAWSVGVPVLISDQTPWHHLRERSIGWDISLSEPAGFVDALEEAVRWSDSDLIRIQRACLDHAEKVINDSTTYIANRSLFQAALGPLRE